MAERVLLTGAGGFVGKVLGQRLEGAGFVLRAVSRQTDALARTYRDVVALPAAPTRQEGWEPLLDGVDHVVHCAGLAHASTDIPRADYMRVNADLTGALARAAAKTIGGRFVFLSSIRAMSGPVSDAVLLDDTPPDPQDDYGRSKLEGERQIGEAFADGGLHTILRSVLIYGPGVKGNLAALARLASLPLPLPIGGLSAKRSLLDAESLAEAVTLLLGTQRTAAGPFIASDRWPVTVAEIVGAMRSGRGRKPHLFAVPDALLAAPLRLTGRDEAWRRLTGPLVARCDGLEALGWRPAEHTADRIAQYFAGERRR